MQLEYHLCDVFTETPFAGNQLAVFPDAGHLTDEQMQALARETNLSETTFICRRDAALEQERGIRVRIFTTQEEFPFAGHPTLGTAAVIRSLFPEYADALTIRLDLNIGIVPVAFPASQSGSRGVYGEMTQPEAIFGVKHDPERIAPLLGLHVLDLDSRGTPQTVSTGLPQCIVLLNSVEALGRLRLDGNKAENYLQQSDAKFFYALAQESADVWRARMQWYGGEDPATGSAAGCAISYFVRNCIVSPGTKVLIRQGVEMRRSSEIYTSAKLLDGKVDEIRVGGSTVLVANGRFFLE
jgi:trans-2,3-dihydro-3-hydroxyanthranilate isomerase